MKDSSNGIAEVPPRRPGERIIASLTSFPARMELVHVAIESILCQSLRPDEVVLWLYRGEFPEDYVFPENLDYCFAKGLKVRWIEENLLPHKKYLYAMREYPDDVIVTFDDDSVYPRTRIAELYSAHLENPGAVVSARVHRMTFEADGRVKPYAEWDRNVTVFTGCPMYSLFPLGVGGVLYPPHILPPEVDDVGAIKNCCLRADDIWLKLMETVNGVPTVRSDSENLSEPLIPGSQDEALSRSNCDMSENDIYLQKVAAHCNGLHGMSDVLKFLFDRRNEEDARYRKEPLNVPVRSPEAPQVSVVVPVYNVEKYLRRCIDSILDAVRISGLRVEVIFVDDGSVDGSVAILSEYAADNLDIGVVSVRHGGLGPARNAGLDAARGEYVLFVDSDGWVDPLIIGKLYQKAVKDGSDVVLGGRANYDERKGALSGTALYSRSLVSEFPSGFAPEAVADRIFSAFGFVAWGRLIRRRLLLESGIRFLPMPLNEDMPFTNSLLVSAKRISIVNEPLYYYRRNRSGSLKTRIVFTPYSEIEAVRHTLGFLRDVGCYDRYRDSFIRFAFTESVVRFRELEHHEREQREFYERLRDEFSREFGFETLPVGILGEEMRGVLKALLEGSGYEAFRTLVNERNKPESRLHAKLSAQLERAERWKKTAEERSRALNARLSAQLERAERWKKTAEERNQALKDMSAALAASRARVAERDASAISQRERAERWKKTAEERNELHKSAKRRLREKEAELFAVKQELDRLRVCLEMEDGEICRIESSISYRVGMLITWPFRMLVARRS